jgi:peptide/nickel transport system substrate-binding protein
MWRSVLSMALALAAAFASPALGAEKTLPDAPLVTDPAAIGREPGRAGGTLRILLPKDKDIRLVSVWGYARLVGYAEDLSLRPDILLSVGNEANTVFTLRLRPGHRWSDGAPFTSEDFRYWWEDVANNPELSPSGPPAELLIDGEKPVVTFPDAATVVYRFTRPNPRFLPALAQARELFLYRPAHYLKRFHLKYGDAAEIARLVAEAKVSSWAALHNRMDTKDDNSDAAIPTLQAWAVEAGGGPVYRFVRNRYFHRVDAAGVQLPYLDAIEARIVEPGLIAVKAAAGDSDLQARGLGFADAAALKAAEERGGFKTLLWPVAKGSQVALYPNLTVKDPVWRALNRDVRFRRALSLAIDRDDLNQTLYFGLGTPAGNTAIAASPLYSEARAASGAVFDPAGANRLLDEIGLTEREADGIRRLPDGRRLEIVVETSGESAEETQTLELIAPHWKAAGVGLVVRPYERSALRNRAYAGESVMVVWSGFDNGVPGPASPPDEVAPLRQDSFSWPAWGQFQQTAGKAGEAPDLEEARRLLDFARAWETAPDDTARGAAWTEMLDLHAAQMFSIGTVSGVMQPVVVSGALRNVPETGIYGWDPGAQFGLHRPDLFWLDR